MFKEWYMPQYTLGYSGPEKYLTTLNSYVLLIFSYISTKIHFFILFKRSKLTIKINQS